MDLNALVNSTAFWIVLAVVVIALILIGIVAAGKKRKESKTISFEKVEEPKELTQQEKSGNYQAKGGFNFAQAEAQPKQPEPIRREKAAPQPEAAAAFVPQEREESVVERAISRDDEPQVPTETSQPAQEEPAAEQPAVPADEPVEQADEPVEPERPAEQQPVADVPAERVDKQTAPDNGAVEEELRVQEEELPVAEDVVTEPDPVEPEATSEAASAEAEAEEAAAAAAAAQTSADEAREEGAAVSDDAVVVEAPTEEPIDDIAPAAGRMGKLRGRLSRSQNAIGQGLLGILTAGDLDEDAWEEIEDTLIMADLGADLTMKVTDSLREKIAERGVETEEQARAMLRETLIEAARPEMDRSIKAMPNDGKPAVILVVGVNGTGKTTTTGKLARVLVSMGHSVVLGAADTFRAAAADQLETWGKRVGASTVRGKEGADPASVAFDAVATGVAEGADVVLVDTAGRLHTSTGLMDQLGKVKRVVEKKSNVDEVLLVLDATVGQNGIMQARVFRDVVDITGVVLTKLDGTAKGGIVFQVQEELGVPVKLVGLGEGADDLAPFEVESFVDALLG